MKIIITIAVLLIAIAFVAFVASNIYSALEFRKERKKHDPTDILKKMAPALFTEAQFPPCFMVTKYWYKTDHRSTEMVAAHNPSEAFEKESDDRRNLDYYIEKVERL